MPDLGAKYTDEQIIQVEKQLKSVYNQAYKDILQKQKDFNEKYEKKEAKYEAQVASGKITQEQFDSWKKGQVFQGEQWQNKKKDILNTIHNSNKIAVDIVNGKTQNVFTFNANYMSYSLEHDAGVNFGFSLYDSATTVNLIKNNPQLLPEWKIDQPKDYTWNQKKLNRQVTLGVIEGESLDKIATRLSDSLATQNFNKMRTFARTAMTGAQNSGRQISLENAKGLGIKLKKEWMATLDHHTRINHRILDGQKVNTDDYFEVNGLKIRYPGDPQAAPAMVYNCRCTMVGDIDNYPSVYNRYDNINGKPIKNMTYKEWEAQNKRLAQEAEDSVRMLDESEAKGLASIFADKKMSNLYNEMRESDTKTATAFYNELKSMGKPSEVWQQYLDGTLPSNIDTSRLNGILQTYAEKKGITVPGVGTGGGISPGNNLKEIFSGKKMSNVYNEMKAVDKSIANQFYKELGSMGKPSDIWQQYLDGKLNSDQRSKIEGFLNDYANKAGLIKPTVPAGLDIKGLVGDKKMSNLYNELKGIDTKAANQFYNELKSMGKPSEVWEKYVNGEIKNSKLDNILKQHYGKDIPTPAKSISKTKTIATPAAKTKKQSKDTEKKIPDKEWVEKNIDKDKFYVSSKDSDKARDKTIEAIMKTPENYRKCFTNTIKNVNFLDDNGKAYYMDGSKRISINFEKILKRDGSLGTLFHENGHAMDYAYMYASNPKKKAWEFGDKDRTSQLPSFLSAIDKDLKSLSKNIDTLNYHKDMWDNSSKGVQDFFSALKPLNDKGPRKGTIPENLLDVRYRWSHSYSYYTRKSDPMVDAASELFANISGGYGDENQMKYMKKYFPNSVEAFGKIIDDMADTIKM